MSGKSPLTVLCYFPLEKLSCMATGLVFVVKMVVSQRLLASSKIFTTKSFECILAQPTHHQPRYLRTGVNERYRGGDDHFKFNKQNIVTIIIH